MLCRYSKRRGVAASSRVVLIVVFIGFTASAPDGSSPRGYVRLLAGEYRLKLKHSSEEVLDSGLAIRMKMIKVDSVGGSYKAVCSLFFFG